MDRTRLDPLFLAALIAGASYYADHWLDLGGTAAIVWKGSGVALLALWARFRAGDTDRRLIAAALGLGALGDVLLETHGMTTGAIAFLAGHIVAAIVYLRNPARPWLLVVPVALGVAAMAWALPADRSAAPGIALYALGLGAMAGAALASRFPLAALGAALFVVSDLLIFARSGPLAASPLPGLLVWPTYFAGQALIAWGVVTAPTKETRG